MICAALGASLMATGAVGAADLVPQDFAYARQIETPDNATIYRVALPLDVYKNVVRSDLGDLRVFNASGKAVPYALRLPLDESTSRQPARQLPLFPLRGDPDAALEAVRGTIESGKAALDLQTQSPATAHDVILGYIVDGRSLDTPVAALQLDWPGDAAEFAGRLQVQASDDLGTWRTVTKGAPVANLRSDDEQLTEKRVEFPAQRANFWKLSWAGAAPSFALTALRAEPAAGPAEMKREQLTVRGKPVAQRLGEITFDLGAHVPVDRITLQLPERNSIVQAELLARASPAEPWRFVGKHGFYRLETRNGEMENGPVAITPTSQRFWLAKLDLHGGGLGTGQPQLTVGWLPHDVMFFASGKRPFELAYGSSVAQPFETSFASVPKSVPILRASLSPQRELGGTVRVKPMPAPFPWKITVLWTVLVLSGALLAGMTYRLVRKR